MTGSNWKHHGEIARNGGTCFDFGLKVGPGYFSWLELIDSTEDRILRCAQNDGQRLALSLYSIQSLEKWRDGRVIAPG